MINDWAELLSNQRAAGANLAKANAPVVKAFFGLNAGATKQEVAEALGTAIALNAGAAFVYSARALEAFDQVGS